MEADESMFDFGSAWSSVPDDTSTSLPDFLLQTVVYEDDPWSGNWTSTPATRRFPIQQGPPPYASRSGQIRIPFYATIFVLAVTGNALVIVTLIQNRRMRTITNMFLLNLSVSDLLLAVLCMPFTLIPTLLKDFIFGRAMCVLIRYMQGVSVGVSVFTLVTISMERFFAICRPLTSMRWQTRRHAYKIIGIIWVVSLVIMVPTAVYQRLLSMPTGAHKCAEIWDNLMWEKVYTIFLDVVLLVAPLLMMVVAYGRIALTLIRGFRRLNLNKNHKTDQRRVGSSDMISRQASGGASGSAMTSRSSAPPAANSLQSGSVNNHNSSGNNIDSTSDVEKILTSASSPASTSRGGLGSKLGSRQQQRHYNTSGRASSTTPHHHHHNNGNGGGGSSSGLESSSSIYASKSRMRAKKHSVQMLSLVVFEFFVCWTPMYIMQTWSVFDYMSAVDNVSPAAMNYIHLLAFVSSCCNPITYCFMSAKFRQGFLAAFRCSPCCRPGGCCRRGPRGCCCCGTGGEVDGSGSSSRQNSMLADRRMQSTMMSSVTSMRRSVNKLTVDVTHF